MPTVAILMQEMLWVIPIPPSPPLPVLLPFTLRTTAATATFTCITAATIARSLVYISPTGFGGPTVPQTSAWTQIQLAYAALYAEYKIFCRQDITTQSTQPLGIEPWGNGSGTSNQFAVLKSAVTAALAAAESLLTQIEDIAQTPWNATTLATIMQQVQNGITALSNVLYNINLMI